VPLKSGFKWHLKLSNVLAIRPQSPPHVVSVLLIFGLIVYTPASQNSDVGQTYTKRRNRVAMRLQIRYRSRNQLGTINPPSSRLQTSLYRADGLVKES